MKRTFKSIMFVAAAAMALTACNIEPVETPEVTTGTHTVKFIASQVDTKTTMDIDHGVASFAWENTDKANFHIFENGVGATGGDIDAELDNGIMKISAMFPDSSAPYTYTGFMAATVSIDNPAVSNEQIGLGAYDPESDILVAKPVTDKTPEDIFEGILFQFKRVVAINVMTLKGLTEGETVSEVTITSDKPIAGEYDFANDAWNASETSISIVAEAEVNADGQAVVYFVSAPVEGAQLIITATTSEGKTYSKVLAQTISFTEGGVKTFGVTVNPVSYGYVKVTSAPADWSGEYLIADGNKVFNGLDAANDYVEGTISNNVLEYKDGMAKIAIEKMEDGYSLKILNGDKADNYISGKSGSNSIVYGATAVANVITLGDDGLVTILSNSTSFRYNAQSGNNRFRYYKTTTTGDYYHVPALYRYQEIVPIEEVHVTSVSIDETLSLEVGETHTLVANVLPENATNKSVTWESNDEDVVTVEGGVVTAVGVGEATITVKTVDGEFTDDCVVTVAASSVSIANTIETAYTVSEAIALIDAGKDLDTQVYVKGVVSEIVTAYDSKYGNISFNVSADGKTTGHQFQFFRNFKGAENDKWTDSDITPRVGDSVIGYGTLTKYNTTYEFAAGNYIVSIDRAQYLEASANKTFGISADGDIITITVDTNVEDWTVESDNDAFVVGSKSGNSVPVVVYANESVTDTRTANITVSAEGVENVVITLTQDAKSDSGQETTTYTLTILPDNLSGKSYAANDGEKIFTAVAASGDTISVTLNIKSTMMQSSKIQMKKNEGKINNVTNLGSISSINITNASNITSTFTKGSGSFSIDAGSSTGTCEKIEIVFTK